MIDEAVEASCTETGFTEGSHCERCNEVLKQQIVTETLGHDYDSIVTEASCLEGGYTVHTCARCGESYTDSKTEALGHLEVIDEAVEASCTETGFTEGSHCERCNEVLKEQAVTETLGHDYDSWTTEIEATHETEGLERRDCARCDAYETRSVAVKEHEYVKTIIEPTCSSEGYTLYTCECGASYKSDVVSASAHDYGEFTVTVEADCFNPGEKIHICEICGHDEIVHVEPLGHAYQTEVIQPTCTEAGTIIYTCERCSDSYQTESEAAKGHVYGEWIEVSEAGCTEGGMEMRDCEVCDHYETRLTEALGHDYKDTVTSPDCQNEGYTTHTCTRCEHTVVDSYVKPSEHGYSEWVSEIEPDCQNEGLAKRICTGCGQEETKILEMTDHRAAVDEAVDATCTETGLTEGSHCETCGQVLVERQVIDALGHEYESAVFEPTCSIVGFTEHTCIRCEDQYWDGYKPMIDHIMGAWEISESPTPEKEGVERRECIVCDYYETRYMPKSEHHYTSQVIEPTCEGEGYTLYTCTECSSSYRDHIVDALDHEYGQWIEESAPECAKSGVEKRVCQKCQHIEYRETKALGHDYEDVIVDASCTQMGYTLHTCKICGSKSEDSYVPANGHAFGQWIALEGAECLSKGVLRRDCEVCDEFETQEFEEIPHDYLAEVHEATCLEGGYTVYTCTRCENAYTSDETEASGHKMSDWNVTADATCLSDGEEMSQCEHCEYTETRTVDKLGHKYVDKGKAATCTESGIKKEVCERCGDKKEEVELKASGHSWMTKTVSATCTRDGYTETYCENCSESKKSNEVKATGHSFGEYISDGNATVDTDGTKTSKCTRCGKKDTIEDPGTKKVISSVSASVPEELVVILGEEFDASKLEMTVTYADGTTETVSDFEVAGFDSSKIGTQELTISYRDYSDTVTIEVKEASDVSNEDFQQSEDNASLPVWAMIPVLGGILAALILTGKKLLFKKKTK